ncbi:putative WD domain-containing protein [Neospora caninum Liverpool]|uniref:Putative WD domain-containing protein n=1 Tax=Neospora caninum (strain Liverpool) TaxID=572307 RepID=F0VQK3_NEOCL|nr:putative WD domain-containing protein [Neospora caninum Liverpool]CBZ56000.1 putative WD domain-containing protein [Neospora caninum Liverpool]CEL70746.1 TPA: WD domain-containing protein, putative [Neospora caninum Liverpool]|eukprot:XP_003886026.1 putative WD domain-containing protein [Neospora caninum Liverpool]
MFVERLLHVHHGGLPITSLDFQPHAAPWGMERLATAAANCVKIWVLHSHSPSLCRALLDGKSAGEDAASSHKRHKQAAPAGAAATETPAEEEQSSTAAASPVVNASPGEPPPLSRPPLTVATCVWTASEHRSEIMTVRWAPTGEFLATCDADGNLFVYALNLPLPTWPGTKEVRADAVKSSASVAAEKAPCAGAREEGTPRRGPVKKGKQDAPSSSAALPCLCASLFPSSGQVPWQKAGHQSPPPASGGPSGAGVYTEKWRQVSACLCSAVGHVFDMCWCHDSRTIALAGAKGKVCLVDVPRHEIVTVLSLPGGESGMIKGIAWDPQASLLAACTSAKKVFVWRTQRRTQTKLGHAAWSCSLVYQHDELLLGGPSETPGPRRLSWHPQGTFLALPFAERNGRVFGCCLRVQDDSELKAETCEVENAPANLSDASQAGAGRRKQLAEFREEIFSRLPPLRLRGHRRPIRIVRFSPDLLVEGGAPKPSPGGKSGKTSGSSSALEDGPQDGLCCLYAQASVDGALSIWRFSTDRSSPPDTPTKSPSGSRAGEKAGEDGAGRRPAGTQARCLAVLLNFLDENTTLHDLAWGRHGQWLAAACTGGGVTLVALPHAALNVAFATNWMAYQLAAPETAEAARASGESRAPAAASSPSVAASCSIFNQKLRDPPSPGSTAALSSAAALPQAVPSCSCPCKCCCCSLHRHFAFVPAPPAAAPLPAAPKKSEPGKNEAEEGKVGRIQIESVTAGGKRRICPVNLSGGRPGMTVVSVRRETPGPAGGEASSADVGRTSLVKKEENHAQAESSGLNSKLTTTSPPGTSPAVAQPAPSAAAALSRFPASPSPLAASTGAAPGALGASPQPAASAAVQREAAESDDSPEDGSFLLMLQRQGEEVQRVLQRPSWRPAGVSDSVAPQRDTEGRKLSLADVLLGDVGDQPSAPSASDSARQPPLSAHPVRTQVSGPSSVSSSLAKGPPASALQTAFRGSARESGERAAELSRAVGLLARLRADRRELELAGEAGEEPSKAPSLSRLQQAQQLLAAHAGARTGGDTAGPGAASGTGASGVASLLSRMEAAETPLQRREWQAASANFWRATRGGEEAEGRNVREAAREPGGIPLISLARLPELGAAGGEPATHKMGIAHPSARPAGACDLVVISSGSETDQEASAEDHADREAARAPGTRMQSESICGCVPPNLFLEEPAVSGGVEKANARLAEGEAAAPCEVENGDNGDSRVARSGLVAAPEPCDRRVYAWFRELLPFQRPPDEDGRDSRLTSFEEPGEDDWEEDRAVQVELATVAIHGRAVPEGFGDAVCFGARPRESAYRPLGSGVSGGTPRKGRAREHREAGAAGRSEVLAPVASETCRLETRALRVAEGAAERGRRGEGKAARERWRRSLAEAAPATRARLDRGVCQAAAGSGNGGAGVQANGSANGGKGAAGGRESGRSGDSRRKGFVGGGSGGHGDGEDDDAEFREKELRKSQFLSALNNGGSSKERGDGEKDEEGKKKGRRGPASLATSGAASAPPAEDSGPTRDSAPLAAAEKGAAPASPGEAWGSWNPFRRRLQLLRQFEEEEDEDDEEEDEAPAPPTTHRPASSAAASPAQADAPCVNGCAASGGGDVPAVNAKSADGGDKLQGANEGRRFGRLRARESEEQEERRRPGTKSALSSCLPSPASVSQPMRRDRPRARPASSAWSVSGEERDTPASDGKRRAGTRVGVVALNFLAKARESSQLPSFFSRSLSPALGRDRDMRGSADERSDRHEAPGGSDGDGPLLCCSMLRRPPQHGEDSGKREDEKENLEATNEEILWIRRLPAGLVVTHLLPSPTETPERGRSLLKAKVASPPEAATDPFLLPPSRVLLVVAQAKAALSAHGASADVLSLPFPSPVSSFSSSVPGLCRRRPSKRAGRLDSAFPDGSASRWREVRRRRLCRPRAPRPSPAAGVGRSVLILVDMKTGAMHAARGSDLSFSLHEPICVCRWVELKRRRPIPLASVSRPSRGLSGDESPVEKMTADQNRRDVHEDKAMCVEAETGEATPNGSLSVKDGTSSLCIFLLTAYAKVFLLRPCEELSFHPEGFALGPLAHVSVCSRTRRGSSALFGGDLNEEALRRISPSLFLDEATWFDGRGMARGAHNSEGDQQLEAGRNLERLSLLPQLSRVAPRRALALHDSAPFSTNDATQRPWSEGNSRSSASLTVGGSVVLSLCYYADLSALCRGEKAQVESCEERNEGAKLLSGRSRDTKRLGASARVLPAGGKNAVETPSLRDTVRGAAPAKILWIEIQQRSPSLFSLLEDAEAAGVPALSEQTSHGETGRNREGADKRSRTLGDEDRGGRDAREAMREFFDLTFGAADEHDWIQLAIGLDSGKIFVSLPPGGRRALGMSPLPPRASSQATADAERDRYLGAPFGGDALNGRRSGSQGRERAEDAAHCMQQEPSSWGLAGRSPCDGAQPRFVRIDDLAFQHSDFFSLLTWPAHGVVSEAGCRPVAQLRDADGACESPLWSGGESATGGGCTEVSAARLSLEDLQKRVALSPAVAPAFAQRVLISTLSLPNPPASASASSGGASEVDAEREKRNARGAGREDAAAVQRKQLKKEVDSQRTKFLHFLLQGRFLGPQFAGLLGTTPQGLAAMRREAVQELLSSGQTQRERREEIDEADSREGDGAPNEGAEEREEETGEEEERLACSERCAADRTERDGTETGEGTLEGGEEGNRDNDEERGRSGKGRGGDISDPPSPGEERREEDSQYERDGHSERASRRQSRTSAAVEGENATARELRVPSQRLTVKHLHHQVWSALAVSSSSEFLYWLSALLRRQSELRLLPQLVSSSLFLLSAHLAFLRRLLVAMKTEQRVLAQDLRSGARTLRLLKRQTSPAFAPSSPGVFSRDVVAFSHREADAEAWRLNPEEGAESEELNPGSEVIDWRLLAALRLSAEDVAASILRVLETLHSEEAKKGMEEREGKAALDDRGSEKAVSGNSLRTNQGRATSTIHEGTERDDGVDLEKGKGDEEDEDADNESHGAHSMSARLEALALARERVRKTLAAVQRTREEVRKTSVSLSLYQEERKALMFLLGATVVERYRAEGKRKKRMGFFSYLPLSESSDDTRRDEAQARREEAEAFMEDIF